MSEEPNGMDDLEAGEKSTTVESLKERFRDLETLQQEVEKRIRDNQRFLERFLDDKFDEEEDEGDEEGESFEEL